MSPPPVLPRLVVLTVGVPPPPRSAPPTAAAVALIIPPPLQSSAAASPPASTRNPCGTPLKVLPLLCPDSRRMGKWCCCCCCCVGALSVATGEVMGSDWFPPLPAGGGCGENRLPALSVALPPAPEGAP